MTQRPPPARDNRTRAPRPSQFLNCENGRLKNQECREAFLKPPRYYPWGASQTQEASRVLIFTHRHRGRRPQTRFLTRPRNPTHTTRAIAVHFRAIPPSILLQSQIFGFTTQSASLLETSCITWVVFGRGPRGSDQAMPPRRCRSWLVGCTIAPVSTRGAGKVDGKEAPLELGAGHARTIRAGVGLVGFEGRGFDTELGSHQPQLVTVGAVCIGWLSEKPPSCQLGVILPRAHCLSRLRICPARARTQPEPNLNQI